MPTVDKALVAWNRFTKMYHFDEKSSTAFEWTSESVEWPICQSDSNSFYHEPKISLQQICASLLNKIKRFIKNNCDWSPKAAKFSSKALNFFALF